MNIKNCQIILKEIGTLISLMSILFLVPFLVGLIYGEWYSSLGFLLSSVFSLIVGQTFRKIFRSSNDPMYFHGFVIAAFAWLVLVVVGGIPLYLISYITPEQVMNSFIPEGKTYESSLLYFRNFLHCVFESMSAYTTTGLTMTVHEPSVGKTILFYRCFAQWIGGAGFIVLALSMFKYSSGRSVKLLYKSESTGISLKVRVMDTARGIWKSYSIITSITILYLIIGTKLLLPEYPWADNIFDSINHAMAGLSSGGFSNLDDSIMGYNSPGMEILYILPMMLGSFSLPFYFRIFYNHQFGEIWKDVQTKSLLILFVIGGVMLSLSLMYANHPHPFQVGVFQYVSAISTTGWQTDNIHVWDYRSIILIVFGAMFIGGAWGGTVGGIKVYRFVLILNGIKWYVQKMFLSPNTVKTMKFDYKVYLPDEVNESLSNAAIFAILFFLILMTGTMLSTYFLPSEWTFFDALFESAAAQSTAGLSVGITDPSMNPVVEVIYIMQMWIGRLEIFPVLALFRFVFFGSNPKF